MKPCAEQPNRQENQNAGKIWYLVQHWHGDRKSVGVLKYKYIEKVCKKERNDVSNPVGTLFCENISVFLITRKSP